LKVFKKIDGGLVRIFTIMGYCAGVVGGFMMLLATVNVILRQLFAAPIFGTVEIVSYCGLLLGAFAIAYNEIGDGNITMTLLTDKMPPVIKNIVEFCMSTLAAVFYGAICVRYFKEIFVSLEKATTTQTIMLPMWIINTIMCIGFFFGTLALALKAARAVAFLIAKAKGIETDEEGAEA